ncbi:MAG: hypothetical protein OXC60_17200 [Litoreibacter sp.]|nr:hypothetical protein [Litoreibacter sp.]MCY4336395.1 hypothetical protein [Litoreibacter sp.]
MLAFLAWLIKAILFDNPRYAHGVFAPIFPSFEVLESRRWHPLGAGGWDCTFAIVSLPFAAPVDPPQVKNDVAWQFIWGGQEWEPTPMKPLGDTTRDAIDACTGYWSKATSDRLLAALRQPGSFVEVGPVGETVFVYSSPQRIAARIRYGD